MNVITTYLKPRYASLANAIRGISDTFGIWQSDVYPALDFFYYNKPDLLLVDEVVVNEAFIEAIKDIDCKLIYFGNTIPDGLHPDLVCAEPSSSQLMRKHLKEQCESVLYLRDCIDVEADLGGEFDLALACDIGISLPVGGMGNVENLKLILYLSGKFDSVKVVGEDNISVPSFMGHLNNRRGLDFIRSSKIFIDVDASNLLRCAANGQLCLSTTGNSLYPMINIDNADELIDLYLTDRETCDKVCNHAQDTVLEQGTNLHRAIDVFSKLGMEDAVESLSKKLSEVLV